MKKNLNSRIGSINLYNPKKEGLGKYDVHYINGYKNRNIVKKQQPKSNERLVAWILLSEALMN